MADEKTGGQLVAECLAREGTKHIFCVPGESYLGVLDAILDHPQMTLVSTRHEGGAAFMAEAYAKSTGMVGVCMATRAVGAANLSVGLHTARQDSTPVVALIGQVERSFAEREAFQEVSLVEWFRPLCKWAVEIRDVHRIPELLQRAFTVAQSGRPGPVVVALPHDLVEEAANVAPVQDRGQVHRPSPEREAVTSVHHSLRGAKNPVIIVGGGVLRAHASPLVEQIASLYQVPVVTAFRRFDAFSNEHPCYAGWLGFGPASHVVDALKSADYVLTVGTRLSQVTSQDYNLLGENTHLTAVDIDSLSLGSGYVSAQVIQSDAGQFLSTLVDVAKNEGVSAAEWPGRTSELNRLHEAYLQFSTPRTPFIEKLGTVDLDAMMADFSRIVPKDTILTSDAGNFFGWVARFYRFTLPGTYYGPTSGAMGYGLPAAIGVKLAYPKRPVVAFAGDGGFMMTVNELETACRVGANIVCIVVNNGLYGTIRAHQERHFPGRVVGTELGNPSFALLANAFGGRGFQVTKNTDFAPALTEALRHDGFCVIEVKSDTEILSVSTRRP